MPTDPPKPWITAADARRVWVGPLPQTLEADLARFPAELVDPFDRADGDR